MVLQLGRGNIFIQPLFPSFHTPRATLRSFASTSTLFDTINKVDERLTDTDQSVITTRNIVPSLATTSTITLRPSTGDRRHSSTTAHIREVPLIYILWSIIVNYRQNDLTKLVPGRRLDERPVWIDGPGAIAGPGRRRCECAPPRTRPD